MALFKRALQLQSVLEIRVTAEEFSVTRQVDEEADEQVFPKAETADVDIDHLLARIELIEPEFDPERYPYFALHEATALLSAERLSVCGIIAPKGALLVDYFGLPEGTTPETFMGIRVIYHTSDLYEEKLVVVGGPTVYFNDSVRGVILDTGV